MKNLKPALVLLLLITICTTSFAQWRIGAQVNAYQNVTDNYLIQLHAGKEKVLSPSISLIKSVAIEAQRNNYYYDYDEISGIRYNSANYFQFSTLGMLSSHFHKSGFFFEFSVFAGLTPIAHLKAETEVRNLWSMDKPEKINGYQWLEFYPTVIPRFPYIKAGTIVNGGVKGNINDKLTLCFSLGLRQELGNDKLLFITGISIGQRTKPAVLPASIQ